MPLLKIALLAITFSLCGCAASSARLQCISWKNDGLMFSTISSCTRCVQELGGENRDAVAGCALGLDAASLIPTSAMGTTPSF